MHLYTNTYIHLLHINKNISYVFILRIYLYFIWCKYFYISDTKIAITIIRIVHFIKISNLYYSICFFNSIPSTEPPLVVNISFNGCSSASKPCSLYQLMELSSVTGT